MIAAPPRRPFASTNIQDPATLGYAVVEGTIAALMVASRLFLNLGGGLVVVFILLTFAYCWLRPQQLREALGASWPAWIYPAVALLSTTWAVSHVVTGRAAVQMSITALAGLMLARSRRPNAIIYGLASVLVTYSLASLAVGKTQAVGIREVGLVGLGGEAKNYFAESVTTAILLMVTISAMCLRQRRALLALMSAVIAGIAAYTLGKANSAGAAVSASIAVGTLMVLLAIAGWPSRAKLLVVCLSLASAASILLFKDAILGMVLSTFHKDAGLTGRDYLWIKAEEYMALRPWLGWGYYGFFRPDNIDAVGIFRYFEIATDAGSNFNFHNAWIQTRIDTGLIGLIALSVSWSICSLALIWKFIQTGNLTLCFWISYFVSQMSKTGVEAIRPSTLVVPTILMFGAMGTGLIRARKPKYRWRRRTGLD